MNEVLKELLESSGILAADTVAQITEAFDEHLQEAVESARTEATAAVTAELTEQYITERTQLIETTEAKIDAAVEAAVASLHEQINEFRDLEVEYNQRLVEEKQRLSIIMQGEVEQLIEALDDFIEMRLQAEVEDLREGIEHARANDFGRRIAEAFAEEYRDNFAPVGSAEHTLARTQDELNDVLESLAEAHERVSLLEREGKMKELLSVLDGNARELMESLLRNVETERLDEAFENYIDRVTTPLTENKQTPPAKKVIRNGDTNDEISRRLNESEFQSIPNDQDRVINRIKELAGISNH